MLSHLPGKTRNDIKNRFYSTLRRVTKKMNIRSAIAPRQLLAYTNMAANEGRNCYSKRGRKAKSKANKKKEIREDPEKNEFIKRYENIHESKNRSACNLEGKKIKIDTHSPDQNQINDPLDLDMSDIQFPNFGFFLNNSLHDDFEDIKFEPFKYSENEVY